MKNNGSKITFLINFVNVRELPTPIVIQAHTFLCFPTTHAHTTYTQQATQTRTVSFKVHAYAGSCNLVSTMILI